jgi:protein TonB
VYSEEARQAALGGTVKLVVIVDENGKPKDLKVKRSLGLGLDEAAIEAVKQWLFRPGMKEGKPVSVQAYIDVNFRLLAGLNGWRRSAISYKPQ